jgi:hypothetical protein
MDPRFGMPSAKAELASTATRTAVAAPKAADFKMDLMMASLLIRFVLAILHKTLRRQFQNEWSAIRPRNSVLKPQQQACIGN